MGKRDGLSFTKIKNKLNVLKWACLIERTSDLGSSMTLLTDSSWLRHKFVQQSLASGNIIQENRGRLERDMLTARRKER